MSDRRCLQEINQTSVSRESSCQITALERQISQNRAPTVALISEIALGHGKAISTLLINLLLNEALTNTSWLWVQPLSFAAFLLACAFLLRLSLCLVIFSVCNLGSLLLLSSLVSYFCPFTFAEDALLTVCVCFLFVFSSIFLYQMPFLCLCFSIFIIVSDASSFYLCFIIVCITSFSVCRYVTRILRSRFSPFCSFILLLTDATFLH